MRCARRPDRLILSDNVPDFWGAVCDGPSVCAAFTTFLELRVVFPRQVAMEKGILAFPTVASLRLRGKSMVARALLRRSTGPEPVSRHVGCRLMDRTLHCVSTCSQVFAKAWWSKRLCCELLNGMALGLRGEHARQKERWYPPASTVDLLADRLPGRWSERLCCVHDIRCTPRMLNSTEESTAASCLLPPNGNKLNRQ